MCISELLMCGNGGAPYVHVRGGHEALVLSSLVTLGGNTIIAAFCLFIAL